MTTIRLPEETEQELERLARQKNVSRSHIIKEALAAYMEKENKYNTPFETGSRLFGRYASGETTRSQTYKTRIREKLREKHTR